MQSSLPARVNLVLIGGGHSHAIALKKLAMAPIPEVRLTLVTHVSHTPYSGMLPGYVAGLYSWEDCHIDLWPLARAAQAQLILGEAIALDLEQQRVILADRPPLAYDFLSIDIGSTPTTLEVPGAAEYAIPVKPIAQFLHQWDEIVDQVARSPHQPLAVSVVGGGAGGVELVLAIQARLRTCLQQKGIAPIPLSVHLIHRGTELLPERSSWARRRMLQELQKRGIQVHLQESVCEVTKTAVLCESGLKISCDRTFWVTQAGAAPWLKASGLATDERGFLLVNDALQSLSHSMIFAAGDIATMVNHPRPKAGVFAVRQGAPLADNLRRSVVGEPLRSFQPQQQYLILLGLGDRTAVASRGGLSLGPHPWLWQWKDWIDRRFMDQFTSQALATLKQMPAAPPPTSGGRPTMRCAGCGAKVGHSILARSLQRLQAEQPCSNHPDVILGLEQPDDAAVITIPPEMLLVQTVDYFPALLSDPFRFGQIVANHCLNDLLAMGATPQTALAIATLEPASESLQEETLYQLLAGVVTQLQTVGAVLVGGHTTEGEEGVLGLVCNGWVTRDRLWQKQQVAPGQGLILTKALGTGVLFAAEMQFQAQGRWLEAAMHAMLQSSHQAAQILHQHGATACTDVTGFGLIGHLVDLMRAAPVSVTLNLEAIALLEGALDVIQQGIQSSLYPQNAKFAGAIANFEAFRRSQAPAFPQLPILFDPQTAGGLLATVPLAESEACLRDLQAAGYEHARLIGQVDAPIDQVGWAAPTLLLSAQDTGLRP
jgi:selenide,water dikinase